MVKRLCLFLVFCVVLAGCEEYTYEITMSPAGDQVVRRVVCSKNMPQAVLGKLAKLYPQRTGERTFEGKFSGELPKDVGGAGTYHCFMTSMGSLSIYSERFRGDDDLDGKLVKMRDWADKLTDLIIGWLESELGNDNNFDKLRKFCDENLRKDIKNLSLLAWMGWIVRNTQNLSGVLLQQDTATGRTSKASSCDSSFCCGKIINKVFFNSSF